MPRGAIQPSIPDPDTSLAEQHRAEWAFFGKWIKNASTEEIASCAFYELGRECEAVKVAVKRLRIAKRKSEAQAVEEEAKLSAGRRCVSFTETTKARLALGTLTKILRGPARAGFIMQPGFPEQPWLAMKPDARRILDRAQAGQAATMEPYDAGNITGQFRLIGGIYRTVKLYVMAIDTSAPRKAIEAAAKAEIRRELDAIEKQNAEAAITPKDVLRAISAQRLLKFCSAPWLADLTDGPGYIDQPTWLHASVRVGDYCLNWFDLSAVSAA